MTHAAPARPLEQVDTVIDRVVARVAPTWPLDRFIAVNPLWGFVGRPLPEVAARLRALAGMRLLPDRAHLRDLLRTGAFGPEHVAAALAESGSPIPAADVLSALASDAPAPAPRRRMTDLVGWSEAAATDVSRICASFFDAGQASLPVAASDGLYATWRRINARVPRVAAPCRNWSDRVAALPEDPRALVADALTALDVPPEEREAYLTALLLDLNGWAAWAAYRRWIARQAGGDDGAIVELLAVWLAWEWIAFDAGDAAVRWVEAKAGWRRCDAEAARSLGIDAIAQRALELGYREGLVARLRAPTPGPAAPHAQVVLCIDVRSERMRRAIEAADPGIATVGFAGFFGLPIAYRAVGATEAVPRLPGPLAPRIVATDLAPAGVAASRAGRLARAAAWKRLAQGAGSALAYVEAGGMAFVPKLLGDALGWTRPVPHPDRAGLTPSEDAARRPRLPADLPVGERADLAASILRGAGLVRGLARVVALVGHGSRTVNNPHAAGLDCGACCGSAGDVNARIAASLLNEPAVRDGLRARGIDVPASTVFVAGLHDTTTDDVTLLDAGDVPASHRADLDALRERLAVASDRVRAERAPSLGLGHLGGSALRRALDHRTRDWAQVRPEWALADNAAFVIAPRDRTRGVDLGGRAFLHDYRAEDDPDGAVLEGLLTAPLVVAHWINLQYYASTVEPRRFGSGDKVLHDVVGGGIGVLEGNGGDLRIGLPLQSVHDGARWTHTPVRLTAAVEAPRDAIDAILARHERVRELVANGWIGLLQLEGTEVRAWTPAGWVALA